MPDTPHPIEKPAHIDEQRMRHISDADLFAALDLARPGLGAVQAAAERADWGAAAQAWANYLGTRAQPVPVESPNAYDALPAGLRRARGRPSVQAARKLAKARVDFTGASHGRTPLYGLHYLLWLQPLVQAHAINRDPTHPSTFVRLFNQWYTTRDQVQGEIESLDVIWYTLGLAQRSLVFSSAALAFRDSSLLDAATQARMLKALLGAGRWLAEEHDRFLFGNWQLTGAAALYELGILWPEFAEAPAWRQIGHQRLLEHLELDVHADGGHSERSPSYHQHVLACLARAASVAELNGEPLLQAHPRFAAMYRWLLEQTSPQGSSTNFNDSHIVWSGQWALQGAVLLEDPELKWLAEQWGTPDDIAWMLAGLPDHPRLPQRRGRRPETAAKVFARLAGRPPRLASRLLAASKFTILRGSQKRAGLFMGINYGPLVGHEYESHSHLDALAFVCSGFGRPLASEAGLPLTSYDDPLYQTWIRRAAAHNMVIVDGADPDEAGKEGDLLAWSATDVADLFEAEHHGYQSRGVRHRRTILFVKDEYWIVYDALRLDPLRGPHRLDWQLYTPGPFTLDEGGLHPTEAPGLAVLPVLPAAGRQMEPAQGLMAVAEGSGLVGTSNFRQVAGMRHVQTAAGPRAVFLHVLYPLRDLGQLAALATRPLALDVDDGEACEIAHDGSTDVFMTRENAGLEATVAGWRTDARVAWLRSPEQWAVYEASTLGAGEAPVLQSSARLQALCLRPQAGGLAGEAETTRRAEVTLFVPNEIAEAYLNEVRLPQAWLRGQAVSLLLPGSGQYRIRIVYRRQAE